MVVDKSMVVYPLPSKSVFSVSVLTTLMSMIGHWVRSLWQMVFSAVVCGEQGWVPSGQVFDMSGLIQLRKFWPPVLPQILTSKKMS